MYCISISHKTAPISVRGKFSFNIDEKIEFFNLLKNENSIKGCVILSTCNRSEIYVSSEKNIIDFLQNKISECKNICLEEMISYLNIFSGYSAIYHLYKVCCGIDSMVLGEDEILGQVKQAYFDSINNNIVDYEINTFFKGAITCAKKIKTDTNLSKTPVSIGTLVANEVFKFPKENKNVIIIGVTGKMGSIILKNILCKSNINVVATVRNHKNFIKCEYKSNDMKVIDYNDRYNYINDADIIISVTSSPHYTIVYNKLKNYIKDDKKRLFIDLAVPIDIDRKITNLNNVTLYNIDEFKKISKDNNEIKLKEINRAYDIMEKFIDDAIKEKIFHDYFNKIPSIKEIFKKNSFENILYKIRDNVSSNDLSVILNIFDRLSEWF